MNIQFKTLKKHIPQFDQGSNDKNPIFYTHEKVYFQLAHKIIHLDYTGWFTDCENSTLAKGIVITLPAMPGFPNGRFLAGYYWGVNGETVLYPEMYADINEAAHAADSHAESFADKEREHNEKWQAARDIEYKIEIKEKRLIECLALRNKKCMSYIRAEISTICDRLRDMRHVLKTDYAGVL